MRRYGRWAGSPTGKPEDPVRCIVAVHPPGRWGVVSHQCKMPRGHGNGLAFCKRHAEMDQAGRHLFIPENE